MKRFKSMMQDFTDRLTNSGNDVVITEGVLSFFKNESKPDTRDARNLPGTVEISAIEIKYPWLVKAVTGILRDEAEAIARKRREPEAESLANIEERLRSASASAPDGQRLSGSIIESLAQRLSSAVKYNTVSVMDNTPSFARTHVVSAFQSIVDRIKRNTPSYMEVNSKSLNEADFSGIAISVICECIDEDKKLKRPWKVGSKAFGKNGKLMTARIVANGRKRGILAEGAYPILHSVVKCKCPICNSDIDPDTDFTSKESLNEFKISGFCEECQDQVFE